MKAFYSISIFLVFALPNVNSQLDAVSQQKQLIESVLTENPWKQVSFTVSPAIVIDEELGISTRNLHDLQSEDEQNQIIKFDHEGNYRIGSGTSMLSPDVMFASRKISKKKKEADENLDALADVSEGPTVHLLETGSWYMNKKNQLVLMADNSRMKEETFTLKNVGYNKVTLSFTRMINGEEYTFKQTLEAQPFIDLGW